LFFLQVGNDPFQFPTFFPFYRLQDLSWTLGLADWGLPSKRLTVLLDEGMLVLHTSCGRAAIGEERSISPFHLGQPCGILFYSGMGVIMKQLRRL